MANRRDPMGIGLAVLNRIASSPAIDRLKLRRTTEKAVYQGAKSGFQAAGAAGRTFKRVKSTGKPTRLARTSDSGVFDLEPTEDSLAVTYARELVNLPPSDLYPETFAAVAALRQASEKHV